jgi:hypothetical protein
MNRDFDRRAVQPVEEGRRENLFYQAVGWLLPDQRQMFAQVDRASYVKFPEEADGDHGRYSLLREALAAAIDAVNGQDVHLRFAVSPGRRPFKRLETVASLREYSLVMVRFIRFLANLEERPVAGVVLPEVIREAIGGFAADGHLESALKIIVALLLADPRSSDPSDLFTLFVRFCCTASEDDFMQAKNVERMIAKVLVDSLTCP